MSHSCCLTFDFDAVSLFMAQGLTTPTQISRGEFGVVGVERILALLRKKDISATFFIPGVTLATYPDICRAIHAEGHEIGHHGYAHISPVKMSREDERAELRRGNEVISAVTGSGAHGYRSPAWDLSASSVQLLLEEGFGYDSSMMAHDSQLYFARTGDVVAGETVTFGSESSLVELPISWSLDDFPHFEYWRGGGLQNAGLVMENWVGDFRYMVESSDEGTLTYTFHPFVIGRGHRMRMLARFIDALEELGAEFLTAHQAVRKFIAAGS